MKEIFFIVDPQFGVRKESARLTERQCYEDYIRDIYYRVTLDGHTCWNIWECFKNKGWKIESVALEEEII